MGTKPAWELWAEAVKASTGRGEQLLAMGAFTADDFLKKMGDGWTSSRARTFLIKKKLKTEVAQDSRVERNQWVRFYFPPDDKP